MTTKLPAAFSPEVLAQFSAKGRVELLRPYVPVDPRFAQVEEGIRPRWYVVEIKSREVEKELAKRRFGIYVPETVETIILRGRKIDRATPMIGGYVFVFLWETDANWQRLARTYGVTAILGWIEDEEIDRLRFEENCERLSPVTRAAIKRRVMRGIKRLPAQKRKQRRKSRRATRARLDSKG
ncbi:transcription termination/antitermination NusG family protein [Bradyrhizobium barranii subsp. apii]|uniref:transcription termination/antitermination protein NusG n=1 Tax=Bradyrhizobium barranii TaxID=2992140 RepID=UPI001AA0BA83|nr:transcription termination/antitermination NusG family protein [Bradyrhizobium barranii]UPT93911.1 transcription termination/antitermination NusG family protein [Bradyrhizobium barranii subsp. apii]